MEQQNSQSNSRSQSTGSTNYLLFISIVFSIFLGLWHENWSVEFGGIVKPTQGSGVWPPQLDYRPLKIAFGLEVLAVLVCLWWWFVIFLPRAYVADRFLLYLVDFLIMAILGLGFRYWSNNDLFYMVSAFAVLAIAFRFYDIYRNIKAIEEKATEAVCIILAMWVLSLAFFEIMMVYFVVWVAAEWMGASYEKASQANQTFNFIMFSLFMLPAALLVTVYSAHVLDQKDRGQANSGLVYRFAKRFVTGNRDRRSAAQAS